MLITFLKECDFLWSKVVYVVYWPYNIFVFVGNR